MSGERLEQKSLSGGHDVCLRFRRPRLRRKLALHGLRRLTVRLGMSKNAASSRSLYEVTLLINVTASSGNRHSEGSGSNPRNLQATSAFPESRSLRSLPLPSG